MKKLIVILALFGFIYSQDKVYTFTEEEVTNMANKVKDLQTQVENQTEQIGVYEELMKKYENQTQIDSMLLSFKGVKLLSLASSVKSVSSGLSSS